MTGLWGRESLQERLHRVRAELRQLETVARYQRMGLKCPDDTHVWRGIQTVAGGRCQQHARELAVPLKNNGYHVWQCIGCGQHAIAEYCSKGEIAAFVSDEVAAQLSNPSMAG